jgi:cis-3-alkyl-4-acyloxetan-2-one decarboxylase
MTILSERIQVLGTDVLVDGPAANAPLILMLHGWPDTRELWHNQVGALSDRFRCARFTWPGFDPALGAQPRTLAEHVALVDAVIERLSPGKPVILCIHDWGCIFGQQYAAAHPTKVTKVIAMDIGDYNAGAYVKSLSVKAKLGALAYQVILALTWVLGYKLGLKGVANAICRFMAKALHAPGAPESVHFGMSHPYAMTWFKTSGGFAGAATIKAPLHSTLYIYGLKKPFMFHSPRWLEAIAATPGSRAVPIKGGHWMMIRQAAEVNAEMKAWLAG